MNKKLIPLLYSNRTKQSGCGFQNLLVHSLQHGEVWQLHAMKLKHETCTHRRDLSSSPAWCTQGAGFRRVGEMDTALFMNKIDSSCLVHFCFYTKLSHIIFAFYLCFMRFHPHHHSPLPPAGLWCSL